MLKYEEKKKKNIQASSPSNVILYRHTQAGHNKKAQTKHIACLKNIQSFSKCLEACWSSGDETWKKCVEEDKR